ncbi:PspC domain-containing protein, partial [Streptomyces prasinopilosus]|uniref:PspC domain-containing protein n=1 Tax=Streptomyces prasinopilosus TaxID=67344 RepID=UPI00111241D8
MTDHQHAATGPGPASGPRPPGGAGPRDAASAPGAAGGTAAGETASAGAVHPPGEAPVPESPPRFRRDRRHQMLGGVCSGLGRQCDMDPVIFRITLAVLSATGGVGLIFYGFAWLLVPYEDEEPGEA